MPPKPIIDVASLDLSVTKFDKESIRRRIPQRFEMEMLDRIVLFDVSQSLIVGIKEVRADEFWARGHFPGRPVMPGVLMMECAGQLSSFFYSEQMQTSQVLGFGSAEEIRFRGLVQPGDRLVMVAQMLSLKARTARCQAQGFVGNTLVFEAQIVGVAI